MKVFKDEDDQGYLKKQAKGGNIQSPKYSNDDDQGYLKKQAKGGNIQSPKYSNDDDQGYLKKQAKGGNIQSPRNQNIDIDMSEIKVFESDNRVNGYQSGKSNHS